MGGRTMIMEEPCNALSNFIFFQAAFHLSCMDRKGLTDEDTAVLVSQLMGMGAGSTYFHVSGTDAGRLGDVLGMQNYFFYAYQVSVRGTLEVAGDTLNQEEKDQILHMGTGADGVWAAKWMTNSFRNINAPFDVKNQELEKQKNYSPDYLISIVAWVTFSVHAIRKILPAEIINKALELAQSLAGAGDVDPTLHRNAVTKAFTTGLSLCSSHRREARKRFVQFAISMIQALIFQESIIKLPPWVGTIFNGLVNLFGKFGISTERYSPIGRGWDVYNGNKEYCMKSSHAKWHEYASHGIGHMLELMQILRTSVVKGDGENC